MKGYLGGAVFGAIDFGVMVLGGQNFGRREC